MAELAPALRRPSTSLPVVLQVTRLRTLPIHVDDRYPRHIHPGKQGGLEVGLYVAAAITDTSPHACPFQTPAPIHLHSPWKKVQRGVVSLGLRRLSIRSIELTS